MNVSSTQFSTQEVASLLNVTETTIKRWSDDGMIACVKTPGGHRKFMLKDILAFSELQHYPLTGVVPPGSSGKEADRLRYAVLMKDFPALSDICFHELIRGNRDEVFRYLSYLSTHQIPIVTIADSIIRPAMERIGTMWHEGKLEISEEHRASEAITEALVRIAPGLHRKLSNGRSVVCACPEGEYHEIGLRSLACALECEGWEVHYLGTNTPMENVLSFCRMVHPDLVCLSMSAKPGKKDAQPLNALSEFVHGRGGRLMVGGRMPVSAAGQAQFDHAAPSVADGVAYVRTAFGQKPGPKSQSHG